MIQEKVMLASISTSAGGIYFGLTDAVSIAIVTQLGALALAGLAAFISWRTHKAVNSRMDEFKVLFASAKINEGVLQEKAGEAKRKGDVAESRVEQMERPPQFAPAIARVAPSVAEIARAVEAVPEKTADKVVEKIEERHPLKK